MSIHYNRIPELITSKIVVGERFVFFLPGLEDGFHRYVPKVPWISGLTGGVPVKISSFYIPPKPVQNMPIGAVCPTKMLYDTKETVPILVCDPENKGKNVQLLIQNSSHTPETISLTLDHHGCALYHLHQPLEGDYKVRLANTTFTAFFKVARYQLVPLHAEYIEHPVLEKNDKMKCKVKLTTYEVPLNGNVTVELLQGEKRITRFELHVINGLTEPVFQLPSGEQDLSINFLFDDKSASLPVRGGKQSERQHFTANPLGKVVSVSTLPPGDDVRGLYFDHQKTNHAPFELENISADRGVLKINHKKMEFICIDVVDPVHKRNFSFIPENLTNGSRIMFDVPDPYCIVFIGAIISGKAYEAYTTVIHPERTQIKIKIPEKIEPGDEGTIMLEASQETGVLVTITDGRAVSQSTLRHSFASELKKGIQNTVGSLTPGEPVNNLSKHYRPYTVSGRESGGLVGDLLSQLSDFMDDEKSFMRPRLRRNISPQFSSHSFMAPPSYDEPYRKLHIGATRACRLVAEKPAVTKIPESPKENDEVVKQVIGIPRRKSRETVLCRYFSLKGKKVIGFRAPETMTHLNVSVQTVCGYEPKLIEKKIAVTKDLFIEFNTPSFVHPKDKVQGKLYVQCQTGEFKFQLFKDGVIVPLTNNHNTLATDQWLNKDGTFTFPAVPGKYTAILEDKEGHTDSVETTITAPGQFIHKVKSIKMLKPGDSVSLEENGYIAIQLLPSLEKPYKKALKVTADYQHLCCEQTAAKIVAASLMYLYGGGDDRSKAESMIVAGIQREAKMFRRGNGFLMYPDSSHMSEHYSRLATEYLLYGLKSLSGVASSQALQNACSYGLQMAQNAAQFHGIQFPPKKVSSCREAYYVLLEDPNNLAAVEYVNTKIKHEGHYYCVKNGTSVSSRTETAFAAAALFLSGPANIDKAIMTSNWMTKQMNQSGAWYSTMDSIAGICMMNAMNRLDVLTGMENAPIEINGKMSDLRSMESKQEIQSVKNPGENTIFLPVQVTELKKENWNANRSNVDVSVKLTNSAGKSVNKARIGEALDLKILLRNGYNIGDLCFICLPPALSFVYGGGQIKKMAIDFEGKDNISVPVAALTATDGVQHYAVSIRNMYDEDKIGNPGWQKIKVVA
ncbi:hypothetical protein JW935_06830 [candidate division KSB1 bacterium]|nr:hypothetical protein [candidate division KSB1 bacterium]